MATKYKKNFEKVQFIKEWKTTEDKGTIYNVGSFGWFHPNTVKWLKQKKYIK